DITGDGVTGYIEVVAGQTVSDVDALIDANPLVEPPAPPAGPGFDPASDTVLYRVNAGGPSIEATDGGPNWSADLAETAATPGDFLTSGTVKISPFPDNEPGDTVPPEVPGLIFDTERSDALDETPMVYSFDLSGSRPGPFEVKLYVANGFFLSDQPGDRIFSVSVDGETPPEFAAIDPVALFGHQTGGVISAVVTVTDGELNLQFDHGSIENPLINGIEIVELGLLPVQVTLGAPSMAEVAEDGDVGVTAIEFPVEVDAAPPGDVTVTYDVLVDGVALFTGLTAVIGADGGVALAEIPNDAFFNGDEVITVTLTGFDAGGDIAELGDTVSATATVTEDDVNSDPVAVDDAEAVGEASGVTVIDVLGNDSDPDGNALSVSAIDVTGLSGVATLNADGAISYNPNGAFSDLEEGESATDILTYTLMDEFGATSTGTVTITITGASGDNTPPSEPTVTPEAGGAPENSPAGTVVAVLSATDADGDAITYALTDAAGAPVTDPVLDIVGNEIRLKAGAALDYEALRAAGDLTLDGYVVASDGQGSSAPTAFSINVTDVAEAVALGDGGVIFRDSGDNEASITGGDGDDQIFGGGGDDDIDGGAGDDEMTGGVGDDTLAGGAGDDEIRGNSGDDEIRGGDGNDSLYGGGGADMIFGEGGDDLLLGVTGNDQLFGGAGNDRLFGRAENDSLDGGEGDDALTGNAGDDVMVGGAGRDVLLAGGGDDVMTGGTERDVFVFQNERGDDVITDFEVGLDKISFRDRTFGEREVEFGDLEITQNGDDAVITERGLSITLNGVDAGALTESDFIF
ncbi:MAG: cadherin-like domain-containing protein, partial [Rhodobacteraceae bacterium]|nr:cadherin-like domain-containing protein [Paracoccaceae bacterium]